MSDAHTRIQRLIEVGRYAEARRLLQSAFTDAPDDPDGHVLAAQIALKEGDRHTAQQHIAQALSGDPGHFLARLLQFQVLMAERRYADAEAAIVSLLREEPASADLLALYARLMVLTAHLRKAETLVGEALRLDPGNRGARLVSVLISTVAGARSAANEQLADLIREDPEGSDVAWTLLSVLVEQRRHRAALNLGQELLRADPGNQELVDGLVELRAATHPLAWPVYPLLRWGWPASAGMWIGAIVVLSILKRLAPEHIATFGLTYLAYVVYSWVHGPLLKRWIAWRGF